SSNGLSIAQGQCIEHYGTGEAYLPVLEALERLGRSEDRGKLREVLRHYAPTWLVHLSSLITLEERSELLRQLSGAGHERVMREMTQALEALTESRALVLILEDLHWCDPSTLGLLTAIARRPEPARLIVLVPYLPGGELGG